MTSSRPSVWSHVRRASRNLRVRVTATATLAAVILAVAGAIVFKLLFEQSLLNSTDDALRTISAGITSELTSSGETPRLAAQPSSSRTTVLQLIAPDGTVRQTVEAARPTGDTVEGDHSTLASAAQIATARQSGEVTSTTHHERVLLTAFTSTGGTWVLLVGTGLEQSEDAAHDAETAFFAVVPIVVVLIAVGAWALSGAVLRPVERIRGDAAGLRERAREGGGGGGGTVHQPDSGDRIEALARTLNGLLGDLSDAAERQRHLVADAGHELRTPLAVLRTELELADREGRDLDYLRDAVGHARGEVERLSTLAEDLLLLADAENRVRRDSRTVDLSEIVEESVRAHRAVAADRGTRIRTSSTGGTRIAGDAGSLRRVVDNLLGNALGVARSEVAIETRGDDGAVVLLVTDDGPGFDAEFLPHAFERFRRADDARHRTGPGGAGLGLAIVAAVATAHGGRAEAANGHPGARLSVTLPSR